VPRPCPKCLHDVSGIQRIPSNAGAGSETSNLRSRSHANVVHLCRESPHASYGLASHQSPPINQLPSPSIVCPESLQFPRDSGRRAACPTTESRPRSPPDSSACSAVSWRDPRDEEDRYGVDVRPGLQGQGRNRFDGSKSYRLHLSVPGRPEGVAGIGASAAGAVAAGGGGASF
jgi:hypothetical protein